MAERLRTCELCSNKIGQLHMLPKDPQVKTEWLKFIFGAVPEKHSSKLSVCTLHFDENDYTNFGQFHSGFAAKLHLKPDAVPSSRLSGCRPTVPVSNLNQLFDECVVCACVAYCVSILGNLAGRRS